MPERLSEHHDPDATGATGEDAHSRAGDEARRPPPPSHPSFPRELETGGGPPPSETVGAADDATDAPGRETDAVPPDRWPLTREPVPELSQSTGPAGGPWDGFTQPQLPPPREGALGPATAEASAETVAAPPRHRARAFIGRGLRELAETVILALLIFLLVRAAVQNFQVEGSSMEPTLQSGSYVLVNKAIYFEINLETLSKFIPFIDPGDDPTRYLFRAPKRGDVIVFADPKLPEGLPERDFIKRIIGEPGDTVEVKQGKVFINGQPLDEPYILEPPRYTYGPETVPPGHYFVLGDNRNNSSDSRVWGMLPKEKIIGMAWLVYWPWDAFGLVNNTAAQPSDAVPPPPAKREEQPAAAVPLGTL